jgi:hypothetical protein
MAEINGLPESPMTDDTRNRSNMSGGTEMPISEGQFDPSGRKGGAVLADQRLDENPAIRVFETTRRMTERGSSGMWVAMAVAIVAVLIVLFAAARYMGPQALSAPGDVTTSAPAHSDAPANQGP